MNRDYIRASWLHRDEEVKTLRPMTEWNYGSKLKVDPHSPS